MKRLAIGLCLALALAAGCSEPERSGVGKLPDGGVDQAGIPASGDALPTGAISYFNTAGCPDGWSPFEPAGGRLLVPTVGGAPGGQTEGEALLSGEDRAHTHKGAASITPTAVSFAGIAGEANHGLAGAGAAAIALVVDKASSGLPYIQLLVCKKSAPPRPGPRPIPSGTLLFFASDSCPDGWAQASATQGRHLVALPDHGTPGLAFGGTSLASKERRAHAHALAGKMTTLPYGVALASGCCASGYAKNATYPYSTTSEAAAADLPHLQLLQCQKS